MLTAVDAAGYQARSSVFAMCLRENIGLGRISKELGSQL